MLKTEQVEKEFDPEVLELRKRSPQVTGGLLRIRAKAYSDGEFPAKVKVLTALDISVVLRCEPCIRMYTQKAIDLGVSKEEIIEFLEVAMAMQGCPGEAWALKTLRIYDELSKESANSLPSSKEEACCPEDH